MASLFLTFLKLGTFIFGSGHALVNAMQNEIVHKRGWLTAEQFQAGWASGNVLPGPIAPKVVAYAGYQQAGLLGAAVAVAAYLLPSVAGMAALAAALAYQTDGSGGAADRLLGGLRAAVRGIKPAVLALLLDAFLGFTGASFPKGGELLERWLPAAAVAAGAALILLGMRWIGSSGGGSYLLADARSFAVFGLSFIALSALGWSAIYVMLGAAAVGLSYLLV